MAGKPSLDIPIGSPDLQAFKAKMNEASSHVGTVSRQIAKQALGMNDAIKTGLMASASSMALGVMGRIAVIVGMVKIVGGVVSAVSDQLQRMVDIADKSANTGFSPEMWQSWVAGAKGAEEKIGQFEGALQNAFQALRPVLNPDWSVWDDGLTKVTAVERAMLSMRELFTTDQDYSGVEMFRNAKTQDDQLAAVLTYMKQLQAIGKDVAALDLAEKLFGAAFADKIRTNQLSIDELLENIRTKSPDAFSTEIVMRAKELDTQLKNAWHTIDQNLHPSMEALDSIALSLKSVWVDIVELMAKASKLLNPTFTGSNSLAVQLSATGEPGFQTPILDGTVTGEPRPRVEIDTTPAREATPLPRRRPTDAPAPPKPQAGAGGVDRFETSAESTERRIAALRAEAQTLDLSSSARDRARVAAQLQTVAMQANAAAGLGANVVTDAQRKRIEEVADAYGKASEAMARAKVAGTIGFGRETAFLTSEDVAIAHQLKDIYPNVATAMASVEAQAMRNNEAMRGLSGTISSELTSSITDLASNNKSLGDSFTDMSKVVVRAINEMLVKMLIVQPLMRGLQGGLGGFGFADGGAVALPGSSDFIGPVLRATGGVVNGPGSGTSDSIPARLSNGEFVVRASETAKNRHLLEAINSGRLRGFAEGGLVGDIPAPSGGAMIGGQTVNNNVSVAVNGSAGTPAQNADLAAQIGKQVEASVRQITMKEIRLQMRPGGVMRG